MPLSPGTAVGPFQVVSLLGAGGMGEVYRARDARLARDVAIKLLPAGWSKSPEWLRRFESEARAAGGINHPNIVHIYDVGSHDGAPYVVSEVLEGETLRSRLAGGALAPRKALDLARQLAEGLAAAHDAGIVHRDLKPENVFVTEDGRVKILDFGLAKLDARPHDGEGEVEPGDATEPPKTQPGVVLGTAGYMAPEQVRGQPVDGRADLFGVGAILYEVFTGRRAFLGPSTVETMNAVLHSEPRAPSLVKPGLSPAVDRLIMRCLEKLPGQRFQNAHDLAFALDTLSEEGSSPSRSSPAAVGPGGGRRGGLAVLAGGLVVAGLAGAFVAGRTSRAGDPAPAASAPVAFAAPLPAPARPPEWKRLTYRGKKILSARAARDGKSVYFTVKGSDTIYEVQEQSPEARPLRDAPHPRVLAVSRAGELALLLQKYESDDLSPGGTLARAPSAGAAAREVLENVHGADFGPDGELAVVVADGNKQRVEWPAGTRRFETAGHVSHLRVSPRGDAIAFLHHPIHGDDRGEVMIASRNGPPRALGRMWSSAWGLAWTPSGEIWFTAADTGALRALRSLSPDGRERVVYTVPSSVELVDVADGGRVLVVQASARRVTRVLAPGAKQERDLSWFDWSAFADLSADGRALLFVEAGDAGGTTYHTYLRPTDGGDAIKIADGEGTAISPDRSAVVITQVDKPEVLEIVATRAGAPRLLPTGRLTSRHGVSWFPDGKRVAYVGHHGDEPGRLYVQDVAGGEPRAVDTDAKASHPAISPDGRWFAMVGGGGVILVPVEGGPGRATRGLEKGEAFAGFAADGRLLLYNPVGSPCRVVRVDPTSGRRELAREIVTPADDGGVGYFFRVTPDVSAYAYEQRFESEDVYAADGLR